ncbi:MAG: hypothetical protein ACE5FG_02590 [Myxococcota bacterium]
MLGLALAISLALLVWARLELGARVRALEAETRALEERLAQRELLIRAQQGRLEAVRDRVRDLGALLDEPLPESP